MHDGEREMPFAQGVTSAGREAASDRWLPICGACGERGEADEIDLVFGLITMVCSRCPIAWTEVFAGGMRPPVETSLITQGADFSEYQHLDGTHRLGVMVRVLCGLVALEDDAPISTSRGQVRRVLSGTWQGRRDDSVTTERADIWVC